MSEEKEKENEKENQKQGELSEQDLKQVTGGVASQIDGIKGESTDDKHKDW
jgi:hypothetical protein